MAPRMTGLLGEKSLKTYGFHSEKWQIIFQNGGFVLGKCGL
jgi:hypothetical protein